ncbi:MAG: nuclear transport factor 2 family protein [Zoogloeaceae bacterium]|nr:nuclear transport factor 2 family protein [Zoogloeaceae bacterium]
MHRSFLSPDEVQNTFYEAVARGDLDTLVNLWSDEEDVVCTHPAGMQLSGLAAIRRGWQGVFAHGGIVLSARSVIRWNSMTLSGNHITEALIKDGKPAAQFYSTHIFSRGPFGWRLVCRQTLPVSEELLAMTTPGRVLH